MLSCVVFCLSLPDSDVVLFHLCVYFFLFVHKEHLLSSISHAIQYLIFYFSLFLQWFKYEAIVMGNIYCYDISTVEIKLS